MPRVFLCDDESHYRSLVRAVLSAADEPYEIVGEASDGRECIELAPPLDPDVLLLDVNMPGMGGIEALPALRELLPQAKIFALTTAWAEPWRSQFMRAGGDAYIEKPRNAMVLPAKLREALGEAPVDPMDVAELMFHRFSSDDTEGRWDVFAPDVEYTSLLTGKTLRGLDAMRTYLESLPPESRRAAQTTRMSALGDVVLVEGTADLPAGEQRESIPVSWTVRVRAGKVTSVRGFRGREDGQRDAGLVDGMRPSAEREFSRGHGWLLSAARRLLGAPGPTVAPS